MSTIGHRVVNASFRHIGKKGLFRRDLEDALHYLKDPPTRLQLGITFGPVLERHDAGVHLCLQTRATQSKLYLVEVLLVHHLCRIAQIRRQYPHLVVCDIRENLNVRLSILKGNVFHSNGNSVPNLRLTDAVCSLDGSTKIGMNTCLR